MFNRQTKMEEGPHCSGSRTDIAKVKTWAATSQIYVKVRQILSEKVQLNANTDHKCTPGTRSLHNNNVKLFKKNWRALKLACFMPGKLEIKLLEKSYQKKSLEI